MSYIKLTESIAVAGQITVEQVAEVAAAGFRVLVNNRPDDEAPGQPGSAAIEAAALAGVPLPAGDRHELPWAGRGAHGPSAGRQLATGAGLLSHRHALYQPVGDYPRRG